MSEDSNNTAPVSQQDNQTEETQKSVNKGTLIIVGLIVISLVWYLFADRGLRIIPG